MTLLDQQLESLVRQYGLTTVQARLAQVPRTPEVVGGYKNLGCLNNWVEEPAEYLACCQAGHSWRETNLGNCWNKYTCDICKICFDIDSSG